MAKRNTHPLEHHPSFRAVIAAASPLAELSNAMRSKLQSQRDELVTTLATACGDLVHGFTAPPGSNTRTQAHHRAWIAVRELDRNVQVARIRKLAPAKLVAKAQRAVDRADVLIGALPGVQPF